MLARLVTVKTEGIRVRTNEVVHLANGVQLSEQHHRCQTGERHREEERDTVHLQKARVAF